MKLTSVITFALIALGVTVQAAAVPTAANTERVDYGCFVKCLEEGRDDCHQICSLPGPDRPRAAGSLNKRDYRCYYMCMRGCRNDDKACHDQCQLDCSGNDDPMP